jgi:carboxypeptidase T
MRLAQHRTAISHPFTRGRRCGPVVLLTAILALSLPGPAGAGNKSLVRITVAGPEDLARLPRALDVAGRSSEGWIEAVVEPSRMAAIEACGLPYRIVSPDVEALAASVKGYYHTFDGLLTDLLIYTTVFSNIARLDTVGWTYEGRPLVAVKISDNVAVDEPDEPELLFMGLHHAREWPSLEIAYFIVDSLLTTYGFDDHVTELVDSREIWVLPCVNPDGYVYCHDQGHDWRKNRRFFPQFVTYGVDLNRNYNGSCNGVAMGAWGTTTTYGTSHYPGESVYCGPFPFSEAEIQAVRDLYLAHDFVFSVSYHTFQEAVLWPWGYSGNQQVPTDELIGDVGAEMASRISRQSGSGTYDANQSTSLGYTTSGDTDDWAYGFYHYRLGSNCLPYTVEACSQFHPAETALDQVVRENFDGAIYLCEIADSVAALLAARVMPPDIGPPGTVAGGDYTVSWRPRNPHAGADRYRLDEMTGLSVITDGAEGDASRWDLSGFQIGAERSYNGDRSYHSSSDQGEAYDAMTTVHPYPVLEGDSLSFWCWYQIEEGWDMGYAEVSADGRCFQLLDTTATFTGSSGGWIRRAHSLEDYIGRSVFFRFRYTTDGATEWEGLYLDEIHPVAEFAAAATLSDAITDTFYAIAGRDPGDYYYRVRGRNAPWGWGDWSCCRLTTVIGGAIPPERVSDLSVALDRGIRLSWSPVTADTAGGAATIDHYIIYRDMTPDFAASPANSLAAVDQAGYHDTTAAVGISGENHYYLVRAVDDSGTKSAQSNRAGEFDRYIQRWK